MVQDISSVLDLQKNAIEKGLHCLTIYKTLDNWSKNIIQTELLNEVKEAIKGCVEGVDGREISRIAEDIITQVIDLPLYQKSLGLFLAFDLQDIANTKPQLSKDLFVVFSDLEIEDKTTCDEIFNLTGLFKMTQFFNDNLCIYISKKETHFYLLNKDFNLIASIENIILEKLEDPFVDGSAGSEFIHSGSSLDEKKMKFAKKILNDAIEKLKEFAKNQNKYKSIIVFYTDDFAHYHDFLDDQLKFYSESKPVIIKKIIGNGEFENEFKKVLEENFAETTKEKLEKYKTSIDGTYAKELEQIIESAREARIHKLYVKENCEIEGFILTKDFPYSHKVDGSEKTNQLLDWIVKKVLDTNGEVFILDKEDTTIPESIVAKLRY